MPQPSARTQTMKSSGSRFVARTLISANMTAELGVPERNPAADNVNPPGNGLLVRAGGV